LALWALLVLAVKPLAIQACRWRLKAFFAVYASAWYFFYKSKIKNRIMLIISAAVFAYSLYAYGTAFNSCRFPDFR
jgi:hypothetical protein